MIMSLGFILYFWTEKKECNGAKGDGGKCRVHIYGVDVKEPREEEMKREIKHSTAI